MFEALLIYFHFNRTLTIASRVTQSLRPTGTITCNCLNQEPSPGDTINIARNANKVPSTQYSHGNDVHLNRRMTIERCYTLITKS